MRIPIASRFAAGLMGAWDAWKLRHTMRWGGTSTGSANAQVVTLADGLPLETLRAGVSVEFIAGYSNSGATTLQVDSTTATSLRDAAGNALTGGELVAGSKYAASYDGTYWRLSGAGFRNPMTTAGDLIVGGSAGTPTRLGAGVDMTVLTSVSGSLVWASPMKAVAFNPADKHSSITLSNDNKTASGSTTDKAARADRSITGSVKVYFEFSIDALSTSTGLMCGVMTASHPLSETGPQGQYFGQGGAQGWGVRTGGFTHGPGGAGPTVGSVSAGGVMGFALDMATGKLWVAINNVWQASGNPAAGTNPLFTVSLTNVFPAIYVMANATNTVTMKTLPNAFTYSPPAGFTFIP